MMSDEELAKWMAECNAYGERAEASQWLPWLKQPAETHTENADRCVCCGEIIPEGRQVCPNCLVDVKKGREKNA